MFERISIELTNQCSKGCSFCYNSSRPGGATLWTVDEVVTFVADCARHGVKAVSFGGGEPLEFEGLFDVLRRLDGTLFRSVTTNGLLLDDATYDSLVQARPDKVHISVHFPQSRAEVARVTRQVAWLTEGGIQCGVNLLVARSQLDAARQAAQALTDAGLAARQIVYLPMRGHDTPTADDVGAVASSATFQSMTCLLECGPSQRFCSIRWDKTVGWCSYTESRRAITPLTYDGLYAAMEGIGLQPCDGALGPLSTLSTIPQAGHHSFMQSTETPLVTADFPAAHSMDTEWFAADSEGNVALMQTGEPGVFPRVLEDSNTFDFDAMTNELLSSESPSPPFDLDDFFSFGTGKVFAPPDWNSPHAGMETRITTIEELTKADDEDLPNKRNWTARLVGWGRRVWTPPSHELATIDAICWLRDEYVFKRFPRNASMLNVGTQFAAWVRDCPARLLRQLYDEGAIVSVMAEEFGLPAHRFGFYVYDCDDDYEHGAYRRLIVPRRELKVHQLPESATGPGELVTFPAIKFADVTDFQPGDYVPCVGWDTE